MTAVIAAGGLPKAVLFACTMNAVRSPMAAAILAHLAGRRVRVESAGVRAGNQDPYMVAVMDEIGIDLSEHEPQSLEALGEATFDCIITLSPQAHHHAIELTRTMPTTIEYWPTKDATIGSAKVSREVRLARYREVRDELFSRIQKRFAIGGGPTV